ncbi:hypothetical protein B0T13DRAFT_458675 [Neurospora crassa]|nr:hypothetical protein B0T13DRAFT_458675 [Neurospora crassa]
MVLNILLPILFFSPSQLTSTLAYHPFPSRTSRSQNSHRLPPLVFYCPCGNAIPGYYLIKPFLQSPFLFNPSFVPPSSLNYFFPLLPVLLPLALKLELGPEPDELDPEELLDVGALMVIVGRKTGIMGVFLRGCDIALSGW